MKFKLILSLLACVLSFHAQAQIIPRNQPNNTNSGFSGKTQDVIYLKDSSVIKGQIIETTPEKVKIELVGGSILVYKMSEVVVIKKETNTNPAIIGKTYHRRDTGFYHHIQTKLNMGLRNSGVSGGVGISYSGGYFINKYLGIGLTAGVERIASYRFVPVLVDFRGYLSDSKTRFYYNLGAGYGFARSGYSTFASWGGGKEVLDAQGGFYVNPAVGIQFASSNRHHFTLDLGYSVNQANFKVQSVYTDWFSGERPAPYTEKNIFYRWVLRAGWTF